MATAGDVISRALRLIGVATPGQALSGADADTGLEALNALVESMGLFRNLVPSLTEETFSLVSGTADYTIGASMTFNTELPIKLEESCFVRVSGIDYPLTVINGEEWADIPVKSAQGSIPDAVYFKRGTTSGELRFYPEPGSNVEFHCRSWKTLTTYADDSTDFGLPAGYERMIAYNLAVEIAPEYGREAPVTVQRIATASRHGIEAAQAEIPKLKLPARVKPNILVDG